MQKAESKKHQKSLTANLTLLKTSRSGNAGGAVGPSRQRHFVGEDCAGFIFAAQKFHLLRLTSSPHEICDFAGTPIFFLSVVRSAFSKTHTGFHHRSSSPHPDTSGRGPQLLFIRGSSRFVGETSLGVFPLYFLNFLDRNIFQS